MKKIWEFFDDLNEVVYVTDMDTDEIVYVNKKTLAIYDFHSLDEVKGKKCYELLRRSLTPCAFCNNDELEEGRFKEWEYFNPVMKRAYILKDTVIRDGDKRYRMELAIDNGSQEHSYQMMLQRQSLEVLANEGMRLALRAETPDQGISVIIEYLGKAMMCDRTYIFERNGSGGDDNTYEWVADGVTPEKDNLQNVPPEVCANWYHNFQEGKNINIRNLEEISESDPLQYENLKRQNIRSLVVVPLYDDSKNIGFYGVDNPHEDSFDYAQNFLQLVGIFIVASLKRRNLLRQLETMSYSDQMTKLGNRFAMEQYLTQFDNEGLGVVYCDITGLKRVNDKEGHKAGDRLILRACDSLKEVFEGCGLFRIGGDELLVLCPDENADMLDKKADLLRETALKHDVVLAVGAVWQKPIKGNIDKALMESERLMYEDKALYYKNKKELAR